MVLFEKNKSFYFYWTIDGQLVLITTLKLSYLPLL